MTASDNIGRNVPGGRVLKFPTSRSENRTQARKMLIDLQFDAQYQMPTEIDVPVRIEPDKAEADAGTARARAIVHVQSHFRKPENHDGLGHILDGKDWSERGPELNARVSALANYISSPGEGPQDMQWPTVRVAASVPPNKFSGNASPDILPLPVSLALIENSAEKPTLLVSNQLGFRDMFIAMRTGLLMSVASEAKDFDLPVKETGAIRRLAVAFEASDQDAKLVRVDIPMASQKAKVAGEIVELQQDRFLLDSGLRN